jgi:hypothetical protein
MHEQKENVVMKYVDVYVCVCICMMVWTPDDKQKLPLIP